MGAVQQIIAYQVTGEVYVGPDPAEDALHLLIITVEGSHLAVNAPGALERAEPCRQEQHDQDAERDGENGPTAQPHTGFFYLVSILAPQRWFHSELGAGSVSSPSKCRATALCTPRPMAMLAASTAPPAIRPANARNTAGANCR